MRYLVFILIFWYLLILGSITGQVTARDVQVGCQEQFLNGKVCQALKQPAQGCG